MNHAPNLAGFRRSLLLVCILMWASAFCLSHIPLERLPALPGKDKSLHFIGFACLGSILLLTLVAHSRRHDHKLLRLSAITLVVTAVYGAIDEMTQPLVRRYGALDDWLADVAGSVAAVVIWGIVLSVMGRKKKPKTQP
jgi:VanZ family protein